MIILSYIIVCIIFGTTFLGIKLGIEAGAPPLMFAGLRFMTAALLVLLWYAFKNHNIISILRNKQMMFIGFCLTFMTFSTLYWAEQYISSGLAAILAAFGPMMMYFMQAYINKEKLDMQKSSALVLAMLGVGIICMPALEFDASFYWFLGCAAVIVGMFFYGLGSIFVKKTFAQFEGTSPFLLNGIQMFYGGLGLILFSFITEAPTLTSFANANAMLALLYLIFVGSIIGAGLFYWLISKTNPIFPATWLYVSPLIALILGYIFLDEALYVETIIGSIFILAGVFVVNKNILLAQFKQGTFFKSSTPTNNLCDKSYR
ncbi:DMT family transporter [Longirhabdus pacifica]|uniref:DMT family transporter n=1 Tax=Longirhabdus pacifica TaxID=2305227 RepID=UPI001008F925|nr:EamA family transporter [Longirhabdus pacifica]